MFKSQTPVLLLIDELPILVLTLSRLDPSGARVRAFLQWFRNLRQHPDGAASLRFVLAGSIGLDTVTRQYQLTDTVNDLRMWSLGPFDRSAAHEFLGQLATSYVLDVSAELRDAICNAAEWLIPYHLQVIFSAIRTHARTSSPTETVLDEILDKLVDQRSYFSYWDERLQDAFGTSDAVARALLVTCAQAEAGAAETALSSSCSTLLPDVVKRAEDMRWILDVLVNDGYLVKAAGRWRFRSGLLRRYWLRHVV